MALAGCGGDKEELQHGHRDPSHGGFIVPVGRDHFHAEIVFTDDEEFLLYILGQDESQVVSIKDAPIGQKYQFCCPPCIDEFVKRAKEGPDSIQQADSYVKR